MPITDVELTSLAEDLRAPLTDRHLPAIEELIRHVTKTFPELHPRKVRIVQAVKGGSLFKGTALRDGFDIDLVFLLNLSVAMLDDDEVLAELKGSLKACLEAHGKIEILDTREGLRFPSVSCELSGSGFDISLGASLVPDPDRIALEKRWQVQLKEAHKRILHCRGYFKAIQLSRILSASINEACVAMVANAPEPVKLAIVLVKRWRDANHLQHFKSFFAEGIVLYAANHLMRKSQGKATLTVKGILLRALHTLNLTSFSAQQPRYLTLHFLGLYNPTQWDGWYPNPEHSGHGHRMILVNPLLPILDSLHSVPSKSLQGWSEAAVQSIAILSKPTGSLKEVFGSIPSHSIVQALSDETGSGDDTDDS